MTSRRWTDAISCARTIAVLDSRRKKGLRHKRCSAGDKSERATACSTCSGESGLASARCAKASGSKSGGVGGNSPSSQWTARCFVASTPDVAAGVFKMRRNPCAGCFGIGGRCIVGSATASASIWQAGLRAGMARSGSASVFTVLIVHRGLKIGPCFRAMGINWRRTRRRADAGTLIRSCLIGATDSPTVQYRSTSPMQGRWKGIARQEGDRHDRPLCLGLSDLRTACPVKPPPGDYGRMPGKHVLKNFGDETQILAVALAFAAALLVLP